MQVCARQLGKGIVSDILLREVEQRLTPQG
jgi:hypothetical protein